MKREESEGDGEKCESRERDRGKERGRELAENKTRYFRSSEQSTDSNINNNNDNNNHHIKNYDSLYPIDIASKNCSHDNSSNYSSQSERFFDNGIRPSSTYADNITFEKIQKIHLTT